MRRCWWKHLLICRSVFQSTTFFFAGICVLIVLSAWAAEARRRSFLAFLNIFFENQFFTFFFLVLKTLCIKYSHLIVSLFVILAIFSIWSIRCSTWFTLISQMFVSFARFQLTQSIFKRDFVLLENRFIAYISYIEEFPSFGNHMVRGDVYFIS